MQRGSLPYAAQRDRMRAVQRRQCLTWKEREDISVMLILYTRKAKRALFCSLTQVRMDVKFAHSKVRRNSFSHNHFHESLEREKRC